MRFLLGRLLHGFLLLVGASMFSFLLADLAPGSFLDELKVNAEISRETLASLRTEYGLDRSLPERYLHWAGSLRKGQWGFSFAYNSPAGPILFSRAGNTLLLTTTATVLAWLIAVPLGILAAANPGKWVDRLSRASIIVLLATPELVLSLLLLWLAVRTGLFPAGGLRSSENSGPGNHGEISDIASHLVLPSLCLAAGLLPLLLTHVRVAIEEALQSPFVEAARGYGIRKRRLLLRHVLPAAANPLISLWGLSLGLLISSSLVVETVFSWPGLGPLIVEAIEQRDFFLVVDAGVLSTAFLIGGNFFADLFLYMLDPRIRIA